MNTRKASEFGQGYDLITDSQELEQLPLGNRQTWQQWYDKRSGGLQVGSAFVKVSGGAYAEVWVPESAIPYLDVEYELVEVIA